MGREEGRWGGRSEECEECARQFSSAVLCSVVQCRVVLRSEVLRSAVQCSVVCSVRAEHSAHMTVQPKKLE